MVYGSDQRQLQNFPHIVANRWMIKLLLACGCTKVELYKVFMVTPAQHIGIEPPPEQGVPARPGWPRNDAQHSYRGHLQGDPQAQARALALHQPRSRSVMAELYQEPSLEEVEALARSWPKERSATAGRPTRSRSAHVMSTRRCPMADSEVFQPLTE